MRRITVLETTGIDNFRVTLNVAFWFPVVQELRVPKPNFKSVIRGNQAPDESVLPLFRSGEWVEEIIPISVNRRHVNTNESYTMEQLKPIAAQIVRDVYLSVLPKYQTLPDPVSSLNIYGTTYTDENLWELRNETPPPKDQ